MKLRFAIVIPALLTALFLASCSYVTPEAENPTPGLENSATKMVVQDGIASIRKEAFGYRINQETNEWDQEEITYLCGWAPTKQGGLWRGAGGLNATPYRSRHCNVQIKIARDGRSLEFRTMNLNYPGQFYEWSLLFSIPILSHYFYEKEVDSRGRELNRFAKVTDRKNWELAPIMDLDLRAIRAHNPYKPIGAGISLFASNFLAMVSGTLTDVFDVELSETEDGKVYFAFTGTVVDPILGSIVQQEYRFNFLEIKDNPNFVPTPYHKRTANHMNILHILGYQPNGWNSVNYAAHWDVKTKPVEFCLNGFPDDNRNYKQIGYDVIDEMNKAMAKIGAVNPGQKAFVVSEKKYKYDFDLRCPAITWVDDPILSMRAPLGIGLVNTNIKTGEILWGGAVVWGGLIDYIVNRDAESATDAIIVATHQIATEAELVKNNPYYMDVASRLDMKKYSTGYKNLESLISGQNGKLQALQNPQLVKTVEGLLSELTEEKDPLVYKQKSAQLFESLEGYSYSDKINLNGFSVPPLNLTDSDELTFDNRYVPNSEDQFLDSLLSISGFQVPAEFSDKEKEVKGLASNPNFTYQAAQKIITEYLANYQSVFDMENLVENHYYAWMSSTEGMGTLEKLAASKTTIKNVMLHELGHVVGLGHQFEGNRMPVKGEVPESVYNELAADVPTRHNYSSIMDYMSGHTEVSLPYEKVKMQAQDKLTLRYLYNQEYSTYKSGDEAFTFFKVKPNGIIPSETLKGGELYQTRYMPQCSDMDAFLGVSPYCRRWDRGHDAPTMVEENMSEYTDSFVSRMNSFTEATGANPWYANYRLWWATYSLMNNNRTFYDSMRYNLANNPTYRQVFDKIKTDEKALLDFSAACVDPSLAPNEDLAFEFTKLAIQPLMSTVAENTFTQVQSRLSEAAYKAMYYKYLDALGSTSTRELDDKGFEKLEERLNAKGLAFSEMQKLCRASKKSLTFAKVLLSLKGPDYPVMDYDSTIVPTGLRGGEARSDYSRIFGTYKQLGLLPVKLAALDVLTSTSSTMQWGWWLVGKPQFTDKNEGKYGYYSLYPREFTEIIGTSVKNNMGFGGTILKDAASMSIANLYMSYFLFRTFFWSNDSQARGFNSDYLNDIKAQTKFDVNLVAVLLETNHIPGEQTNRRHGVRPRLFNFAERKLYDLSQAYILPRKKVIVEGSDDQIIMPLTKLRFINQKAAYVWALEITYDRTHFKDPLQAYSVKTKVSELTKQELEKCISGRSGLSSFFNSNDEFEGFIIGQDIAKDDDQMRRFEESLEDAFAAYESREGLKPSQNGCEESFKGIGLIVSTAMSLNGYFMPQVFEYINK